MDALRIQTLALALALWLSLSIAGCKEPYRVGEHVWVEWEGRNYPAYIIERKGETRYRVHFDGYEARWDEDVTLDRIKGRITGPVVAPPAPEKVARASGLGPKASSSAAPVAPYQVGDKLRVKWRGSLYPATVLEVIAPDRFLVHYDGHESAWDEVVSLDRIAGTR
jgi:hypothetical protein